MDTSISPEYPADLPVTHLTRPARLWVCPWYVSFPAMFVLFAAVIAGLHFVVRPMAASYTTCQVTDCRP